MKVRIEIDEDALDTEVVIKCKEINEDIIDIQKKLLEGSKKTEGITLRNGEKEYFIELNEIYFFQTDGKKLQAHTADRVFETNYKLYELEDNLSGQFMRISKSTIVNLNHIYSITKNITASSEVEFTKGPKTVYVSRNYYKALIERLEERRRR